MKTKVISVLLVFVLSVSITGCAISNSDLNLSNSSLASSTEISITSAPTSPSPTPLVSKTENTQAPTLSNNSVLEAYKAVLQNKAEFFSTDNKKKLYLDDFLTNQELYGTTFKVTHFAVLDMDSDKMPEVVLELSVGDYPEFYEVLHDINGVVTGYLIVYRGLEELKADGTFGFSNGAADNGWGKMSFESDAFKEDTLAYSESSQGETEFTIAYFIDDKPVTKEAYDSFANEQSGKKDAVWIKFLQKNIETELSENP